jgi:ABC-type phosphate transport system auxiliary subunit
MRPENERSDWTDTDLLTNDQARERLEKAVGQLRGELSARRADGAASRDTVAELEGRLARFQESLDELRRR